MALPVRPAVLRMISGQDEKAIPSHPDLPAVVAHASRDAQTTAVNSIINYSPDRGGTFRLTVSVFIESPCDSGTLSVNAYLSPVVGHSVGQTQKPDCTTAYTNTTSTVTAHAAAGVPINAGIEFNGVDPGSLRYMVDAIVEQLQ